MPFFVAHCELLIVAGSLGVEFPKLRPRARHRSATAVERLAHVGFGMAQPAANARNRAAIEIAGHFHSGDGRQNLNGVGLRFRRDGDAPLGFETLGVLGFRLPGVRRR